MNDNYKKKEKKETDKTYLPLFLRSPPSPPFFDTHTQPPPLALMHLVPLPSPKEPTRREI